MKLSILFYKVVYRFYLMCRIPLFFEHISRSVTLKQGNHDFDRVRFKKILNDLSSYLPFSSDDKDILEFRPDKLRIFDQFVIRREEGFYRKSPLGNRYYPLNHWTSIRIVGQDGLDDVKFLWEINRLNELDNLLASYVLRGDEKPLSSIKDILKQWTKENPYNKGINWFSNMEVAIRLIRLLLCLCVLPDTGKTEMKKLLDKAIAEHYLHVKLNWLPSEKTMHAGNHLIVEIASLACCEIFTGHLGKYCDKLDREVRRQFNKDGSHFEGSTGYHVYILTALLSVEVLARCFHLESPLPREKMMGILVFTKSLMSPGGKVPNFGDWDDGYIFRPFRQGVTNISDIIALADMLYGDIDEPDFSDPQYFKESGLIIYKDSFHIFCFKASDVDYGHTHLDMLSIYYADDTGPVILDGGTYAYNYNRKTRDFYRSLAAHSTIVPENPLPLKTLRNFAWKGRLKCKMRVSDKKADAYWKRDSEVFRRKIDMVEGGYVITDSYDGPQKVYSQLIAYGAAKTEDGILLMNSAGKESILIITNAEKTEICDILISPSYGTKVQAKAVKLHFKGTLVTELKISGIL